MYWILQRLFFLLLAEYFDLYHVGVTAWQWWLDHVWRVKCSALCVLRSLPARPALSSSIIPPFLSGRVYWILQRLFFLLLAEYFDLYHVGVTAWQWWLDHVWRVKCSALCVLRSLPARPALSSSIIPPFLSGRVYWILQRLFFLLLAEYFDLYHVGVTAWQWWLDHVWRVKCSALCVLRSLPARPALSSSIIPPFLSGRVYWILQRLFFLLLAEYFDLLSRRCYSVTVMTGSCLEG